jgi:hypothetical protein
VPQGEVKTTWGIKMIYPLVRKGCSREDCIRRAEPLEQLDRVIEEIRKMMLSSVEAINKGELNRGEFAIAAGKKKKKTQH